MVLAVGDGTWTFRLCSICILHNTILVGSSSTEKNKEPLFLSSNIFRKSYDFEDFFWTGSGGGPMLEDLLRNDTDSNPTIVEASPLETWRTTTVFHTTTILFATVYPSVKGCGGYDCMPRVTPVQTGSIDFSITFSPSYVPDIRPSSTVLHSATSGSPDASFDKKEIDGTTIRAETSTFFSSPKNFTTISRSGPESPKTDGTEKSNVTTTTVFPEVLLDQKHWLLTILKDDIYLPNIEVNSTEKKLSKLYREAFDRREEKLMAGNDYGGRKERKMSQAVNAHIVNVTRIGNDIGIIYYITVAGNPVPANAAAKDMRLLTASEVIAELGRPILTIADPYVKVTVPLGARVKGKARDTWLLIGCVIAAIFLLVLLLGLFALLLSKNQKKKKSRDPEEEGGKNNLGFEEEIDPNTKNLVKDTQKSRLKSKDSKPANETTTGSTVKFKEDVRRESFSSSSCSGSSDVGLVRFRQMKKDRNREDGREKPKPKPRTRGRKIRSSDCGINDETTRVLSGGSAISKNTFDCSATEECTPRLTKSPTSYLSMPSVKAFPRGTKIPDPLSKVLEPTSIRHLDADSDSSREYSRHTQNQQVEVEVEESREVKTKFVREKAMTRHGSLEGDDPGFIGPIVWNRHRQKILERDGEVSNEEEYENVNVGKMRRRFNELLDDALSMFGSRNGSPEGNEMPPARQLDNRVHSAVLRPSELDVEPTSACRPNTTGSKRPHSSAVSGPKGAWKTPSCSTIGKSIGSPSIDKNLIFVNSELSPGDPAVPLIAAIKKELKKFDSSRECGENLN